MRSTGQKSASGIPAEHGIFDRHPVSGNRNIAGVVILSDEGFEKDERRMLRRGEAQGRGIGGVVTFCLHFITLLFIYTMFQI